MILQPVLAVLVADALPLTVLPLSYSSSQNSMIANFEDDSDGLFTIGLTLKVLSPNGGEKWEIGTTQTITWSSQSYGTVKILISRDGGNSWHTIISSTPNDGSHPWKVVGQPTDSALIRITAYDYSGNFGQDTSDRFFTIRE